MEETGFGFMLNGVFYGALEILGVAVGAYLGAFVMMFLMARLTVSMADDEDAEDEEVSSMKHSARHPISVSTQSAETTEKEKAEIDAFAAAGTLFKTRNETARFFRANPEEHFATPRGQEVVKHYLRRYEEYLRAIGDKPDASGVYHDSHWVQVNKYLNAGRGMRELPSLPPKNSRHWRLEKASCE